MPAPPLPAAPGPTGPGQSRGGIPEPGALPAGDRVELAFESDPALVAPARRCAEAFARRCGCDEGVCAEVGLVVNEALANVIRHAYGGRTDGPVRLAMSVEGPEIQFRLRDWGCGADPSKATRPGHDPLEPGGLGLICLQTLMDRVVFEPQPDGMLLILTRRRFRPARAG